MICKSTFVWTSEQQQHECSFHKYVLWMTPLRTSAEKHLTGGWIWHLGTWRAMSVFQVLQRDEQRIEPCNLQTTTKFMFSSKWFSLTLVIIQTNFCVGLAAVALGWSLPPGINTLILWLLLWVWCDLNEGSLQCVHTTTIWFVLCYKQESPTSVKGYFSSSLKTIHFSSVLLAVGSYELSARNCGINCAGWDWSTEQTAPGLTQLFRTQLCSLDKGAWFCVKTSKMLLWPVILKLMSFF